jgi:dihydrodipicolinate synthase/N-acetylneuraminate lyase
MNPIEMIKPKRKILGMAAVLLPFLDNGEIDWQSLTGLLQRTAETGLVPAVNMDTGYGNLLDEDTKLKVLRLTKDLVAGRTFVAGVFVADQPGAQFKRDDCTRRITTIAGLNAIPVICQSFGLSALPDDDLVRAYEKLGSHCDRFIAFELGTMFAPFGKIYSLDAYQQLMKIKSCIGAKHSSLNRELEWQRLELRDRVRPEFHVFTGNDLAIDMVMYGSDYLLGLATFAPDLFARRDAYWASGDPAFYELNDRLQFLGAFGFRDPVPGYKHSAAQFLHLRGWINSATPHPRCPRRPESDIEVLRGIGKSLRIF